MFGALGFFGARDAALDQPDVFGALGFFGALTVSETFHLTTEGGDVLTTEGGDQIVVEE